VSRRSPQLTVPDIVAPFAGDVMLTVGASCQREVARRGALLDTVTSGFEVY